MGFEPTRIIRSLDLKSNALTTEFVSSPPVYFILIINFIDKTIGDKAKIKQKEKKRKSFYSTIKVLQFTSFNM